MPSDTQREKQIERRRERARELTEPPTEGETPLPLSIDSGQALLADMQALLELAQQRVVESGL